MIYEDCLRLRVICSRIHLVSDGARWMEAARLFYSSKVGKRKEEYLRIVNVATAVVNGVNNE